MKLLCSPSHLLKSRLFPIIVLALVAASPGLRADLQWESRKIELTPKTADTKTEATFRFTNVGTDSVTIDAIHSSGPDTQATVDKKAYAPGEKGELRVVRILTGRQGRHSSTIRVSLQNGQKTDELILSVLIPEVARLAPSMVSWEQGETPGDKIIEVRASAGHRVQVVKAVPAVGGWKARIEAAEGAIPARLILQPEATDKSLYTPVEITALVDGVEKRLRAHIRIGAGGPGMPMELIASRNSTSEGAQALDVNPPTLVWPFGGEPTPQELVVSVPAGTLLKIRSVTPSNGFFDAKVEEMVGTNAFRIWVKPDSLDKMRTALITIEADSGTGTATRRIQAQITRRP